MAVSSSTGSSHSGGENWSQSQNAAQNQASSASQSGSYIPEYSQTPILERIAQYAEHMAPQVYQWGMDVYGKNQGNIDSLMRTADTYASGQRLAADMGMAESGVEQAGEHALENSKQDLESYGIDPSSGRYAALDKASKVQTAAAAAGAGNQQRQADIATGNAMKNQAISAGLQNANFGLGVGKGANDFLSTGMRLPYSPLGTQSSSTSQSSGGSQGGSQGYGYNQSQSSNSSNSEGGGGGGGSGGGGGGKQNPQGGGGGNTGKPAPQPTYGPPGISGGGGSGGGGSGGGGYGGQGIDGGDPLNQVDQNPWDTGGTLGGSNNGDPWGTGGDPYGGGGTYDGGGQSYDDPTWNTGDAGGDDGGSAFAEGGPVDDQDQDVPGGYDPDQDGQMVQQSMSPSGGQAIDDVPARLNAGEFVMPDDVTRWKGEEFFQNLIEKSRQARSSVMQAHGQMQGQGGMNMGGAI